MVYAPVRHKSPKTNQYMKKDRAEQAPSKEKNHQDNPLPNRPFTIQMPSSNIVVSNGKNFRYCKIFLRP
jgi:hypothetical protein